MRQETGSKPNLNNKKVSIQVKLGGRSFSAENLSIEKHIKEVEFVIDTPRVVLIPRNDASLDTASQYLQLVGKPCRINEQSVCSELQADIVAAIAMDKDALASIVKRFGKRASFTSPLLDMRHNDEFALVIDESENVCYLRLFNNGLQRAEAIEISTPTDVLYYAIDWLDETETPIYIKGSSKSIKLLRKYFTNVICE